MATGATGQGATQPLTRTIAVDRLTRSYLVYLPERKTGGARGVILAFHGGGGSAENFARVTKLHERARAAGFIVVYPSGYGRSWNGGDCCGPAQRRQVDDIGFVRGILQDLRSFVPYNETNVFATGFSTGGKFTYLLACRMSERLAGAAVVASPIGVADADCTPARPLPLLHIHGTGDTYAPIKGGRSAYPAAPLQRSLDDTIQGWIRRNQCEPAGRRIDGRNGTTWTSYQQCRGGGEVTLCTIPGMGHQWPGGEVLTPRRFGAGSAAINATDEIVAFFARHST